jgi:hypothetical protein
MADCQAGSRYASGMDANAPPIQPSHARTWRRIGLGVLVLVWAGSLVLTWNWATRRAAPDLEQARRALAQERHTAGTERGELDDLRQQVATLKRSDQISRNANLELQNALAEREEEVSGLRADVDFYERLVGSTGQRQGLRVHEALFAPESGGTWHYTVTLTQNLNRGAISKGTMRFVVDGIRDGKLGTVGWDELTQEKNAPGKAFSFRYFQQLEDSVVLPPGFTPQRVRVTLQGNAGRIEKAFTWDARKVP